MFLVQEYIFLTAHWTYVFLSLLLVDLLCDRTIQNYCFFIIINNLKMQIRQQTMMKKYVQACKYVFKKLILYKHPITDQKPFAFN